MPLVFGVGLPLEEPIGEIVALAREAEAMGYACLWANDERMERDVYSVLSVVASQTRRLRLGPGVTNPYSRHPALTAVALATLDEISDGRAVLGIGAGGTNHATLGIRRESPAVAVWEAIETIRAMVAGLEITLEGRVVRVYRGRLDFTPPRPAIPVYVGARGPQLLRLAGEVADGVIVGGVATVEGWRYALGEVGEGTARAKRRPGDVQYVAWLYTSVADDPGRAIDAIRPMVATSLATSRPVLDRIGIEMPAAYAKVMEAQGWSLGAEAVRGAAREVPDATALRFGLAGTPEQCAARLSALLAAVPEISQVVVLPFPPAGETRLTVLRRFLETVAPRVQR